MNDVGNGLSGDDFEVEISAIEAGKGDDTFSTAQIVLGQGLSRKARARRLALAASALLAALLVLASVPSLRGQALGLFGGAASPTPTSGWFSYTPLTSQPAPGWMLAGPRYASSITFAPSNPATAYTCGVQQPAGGQPVPLIVGVSHDGGRIWHTLRTPVTGGDCGLSVDPTNAQDVMLIASPDNQCSEQGASKLYRTFDGGAHWSLWSLPPAGPSQSSASCYTPIWVDSTLFIAPDVSGYVGYRQLASSVAGQAFIWLNLQSLFTGAPIDAGISGLFATNTTLYAQVLSPSDVTNSFWDMQSHDNGVSWSRFNPMFRGHPVSLMGIGGDGRTLLGQIVYPGPPASQVTLLSADGGATWNTLPPNPGNLLAAYLAAAPDSTVYAEFDQNFSNVSTGPQLGIYRAVPGASSWSYVAPSPGEGWFIIAWDEHGHPTALWGSVDATQMLPAIERHQP